MASTCAPARQKSSRRVLRQPIEARKASLGVYGECCHVAHPSGDAHEGRAALASARPRGTRRVVAHCPEHHAAEGHRAGPHEHTTSASQEGLPGAEHVAVQGYGARMGRRGREFHRESELGGRRRGRCQVSYRRSIPRLDVRARRHAHAPYQVVGDCHLPRHATGACERGRVPVRRRASTPVLCEPRHHHVQRRLQPLQGHLHLVFSTWPVEPAEAAKLQ